MARFATTLALSLTLMLAALFVQGTQASTKLVQTKPCVWKGPVRGDRQTPNAALSGHTFDLNPLENPNGHYSTAWTKSSIYVEKYYFQLCGNMHFNSGQVAPYTECNSTLGCPTSCIDGSSDTCGNNCAALQLQNDPRSYMFSYTYCHTIGKSGPEVSYELIDEKAPSKGVKYMMNGGDSCGTNGKIVNHTLTLNIVCDKKVKELPTQFDITSTDDCAYYATINHKSGCPASSGGSGGLTFGGVFLIIFFVGGFCYFAAGFAYNMKYQQLQGLDALPNKGFWIEVPGLVKDGAFFTVEKLQMLLDKTKAAYQTLR